MSAPWRLTDDERGGVKTVTDLAVEDAGGQVACGSVSGRIRQPTRFSEYRNHGEAHRYIPLDVAVEIDRFNLRHHKPAHLVAHAARLIGMTLAPAPRRMAGEATMLALAHVIKESAEATSALADLASTNAAAPSYERAKFAVQQIDEAVEALLEMRSRIWPPAGGEGE